MAVIASIKSNAISQSGACGSQSWMSLPPATASNPTTITQKYQYSQPTENPAQSPSARRL
ncbi:Uncharacterised protein [Mycobacteroides abscessus subsp. abscessus]|nr:Uncharacterised protein [Mycobacteroides abscessus subsp. abscessus]SKU36505.1 Uncharacterised protein [Mycobacteroides abscessus subsp. abscessus]